MERPLLFSEVRTREHGSLLLWIVGPGLCSMGLDSSKNPLRCTTNFSAVLEALAYHRIHDFLAVLVLSADSVSLVGIGDEKGTVGCGGGGGSNVSLSESERGQDKKS